MPGIKSPKRKKEVVLGEHLKISCLQVPGLMYRTTINLATAYLEFL